MLIVSRLLRVFWVATLLLACTPQFNWREITHPNLGYTATFPDKPVEVTRTLELGGQPVDLTLQAAKVNDLYFAVGHLPIPPASDLTAEAAKSSLAQALAANVRDTTPDLRTESWLGLEALHLKASGAEDVQGALQAEAWFFERKGRVYEVMLIGPVGESDSLIRDQWFTGFSFKF